MFGVLARVAAERNPAALNRQARNEKGSHAENQDCVDHESVHGYAPSSMMIRQSNILLSALCG
jgi:hypothetical protein